ncbi:MAG: PEP-utilizing enzyme [Candidatus Micrarchaeota archaeon]
MRKPEFYEYFADCTPALVIPALDSFHGMTADYWGRGITFQMMPIEGIRARYYIRRKETLALGEYFVNKLLKNPELYVRALAELKAEIGKIDAIREKLNETRIKSASDSELFRFEEQINAHYRNCLQKGYIVEPAYFYLEHAIRGDLGKFLSKKGLEKEYSKYFVNLTPIAGEPFHVSEEKGLLRILANMTKEGMSAPTKKMLSKHASEFYWINDSYAKTRELDEGYFLKMIREKRKNKENPNEKLAEIEKKEMERKLGMKNALSELELPKHIEKHLVLVGKIAYIQDTRKIGILKCVHISDILLKEIARRFRIPHPLILYMAPNEINEAGLKGRALIRSLEARSKYCLLLFRNSGTILYSGKEAREFEKKILGDYDPQKHEATASIRGICASLGYAVGRARIVLSAKDIGKVRKGEVLVVASTRPDMVPAMKNACAIVTNEGGITSHAAIVSRELGKPCIIGTKIATKAFQDGDLLEVKANHGEVNKLEG